MESLSIQVAWPQPLVEAVGEQEIARLECLSLDELCAEVMDDFVGIANRFVRLAAKVRLIELRGGDVHALRVAGVQILRKIAAGQILPELASKFWIDNRHLFCVASRMPIPDQEKIAHGEGIEFVFERDGRYEKRMISDLNNLNPSQLSLVFAKDHIRSEQEQILELDRRKAADQDVDEFDDAFVTIRIAIPVGDRRRLAKKAKELGQSESDLLLEAARARRLI